MASELLIRCRGSIGDALHYLACVPAVRAAYPGHRIVCAIQSTDPLAVRELLAADSRIDAVWLTPEWHSRLDPAARFLARARIAWRGEYLEFLLPGWGDCARFAADRPWTPRLEAADHAFAARFRERELEGRPFLVVHAASRRDKGADWEWAGYPELVERLAERTGAPIVVVGDPVALRDSRGTVFDLTRNRRLGIGLRPMLALILHAEVVIGGDSGFEVAAWLAGRPVISLVPGWHLRRGYRVAPAGGAFHAPVQHWLPPIPALSDRQAVLPLESTAVDDVLALVAGMNGPTRAAPRRPAANRRRAQRPRPLGPAALLRHAVPDLLRPLLRVVAPPMLRLRARRLASLPVLPS